MLVDFGEIKRQVQRLDRREPRPQYAPLSRRPDHPAAPRARRAGLRDGREPDGREHRPPHLRERATPGCPWSRSFSGRRRSASRPTGAERTSVRVAVAVVVLVFGLGATNVEGLYGNLNSSTHHSYLPAAFAAAFMTASANCSLSAGFLRRGCGSHRGPRRNNRARPRRGLRSSGNAGRRSGVVASAFAILRSPSFFISNIDAFFGLAVISLTIWSAAMPARMTPGRWAVRDQLVERTLFSAISVRPGERRGLIALGRTSARS